MRTIEQTGQFKRDCDYKREIKGPHRQTLASDFGSVITALANDQPLAEKHRDHALTGDWKDHRDCRRACPMPISMMRRQNDYERSRNL